MVKSNIVIKYQINILVGIWEINNEIVINIKAENKLHTLKDCSIYYNHDQNIFHNQKLKKQRLIKKKVGFIIINIYFVININIFLAVKIIVYNTQYV